MINKPQCILRGFVKEARQKLEKARLFQAGTDNYFPKGNRWVRVLGYDEQQI